MELMYKSTRNENEKATASQASLKGLAENGGLFVPDRDFTARALQRKFRAEGKPWELCKGFDGSAAIGEWVDIQKFRDIQALHFHLDINGKTVQEGCTSDMLFRVDEIIAFISRYFTLKTGDILYTGTPVGVGPVNIDDHLTGYIEDRKLLEFNIK